MGSIGSIEKQVTDTIQDVNEPPKISAGGKKKDFGSYLSFNRTQPIKIPKVQKIAYKSSINRHSQVFKTIEDQQEENQELGKIKEE